MKTKMIATRGMRYGTRALKAGDEFEASRMDARVLHAVGRAEFHVATPLEDDLDALRAAAEKLGVKVDSRWRQARLREEIEKASA